jgi:hypothetical protein
MKTYSYPKNIRGWGLKDIHLFGHSLAAKSLWQMMTKDNLWSKIITHKYIAPNSLLDWINLEGRTYKMYLTNGNPSP